MYQVVILFYYLYFWWLNWKQKDNFYLELGDFGDDAGFYAINALADAIGVADGASGNAAYGYDPGDFSRHLMRACAELFAVDSSLPPESHFATDPRRLLLKAYDAVQDSTSYGMMVGNIAQLHTSHMCFVSSQNVST